MVLQDFDVIVVGAGSGLIISDAAASAGLKVAIVERGPMGGTCLNRGCIPSKMVIHSGDVAQVLQHAKKFGILLKGYKVNFSSITKRVSGIVDKDSLSIEKAIKADKNTTLFKGEARFIRERTLQVGKHEIRGQKVFIAAGTREFIPPVEGLSKIRYLTSTEALRLRKQPKSLTIIGGGYIAAEMAHFYGSLGTKINIIQREPVLVPREDSDIAAKFTEIYSKKYNVVLSSTATKVEKKSGKVLVTATSLDGKKKKTVVADELLVATGRVSNADSLNVKETGVEVSQSGYIKVNEYLETSTPNIWAIGDIAGIFLFKHSANLEAEYAYKNAFSQKKEKVDYYAMPHAVFSSPQIAGVGMTEDELKKKSIKYILGRYEYAHTGMGEALQDKDGFCKIMIDPDTHKILGCHIIGTDASSIIHEVIVAMKAGEGKVENITNAVHIHPALSEVVQRAAFDAESKL